MTETDTTTGRQQIGTVRITRTRSYPLDPSAPDHLPRAEVLVEPGEYPVYQDGLSHYWRMTGVINHRHYRLGDGMFAINQGGDVRSEDDVVFYSGRLGPDEFAGLMADFAAMREPALVFTVSEPGR
jgi:hypothetical protein